jgi:flagellar assembly factor FliW
MVVKTKVFGEVEVADDKILTFDNGIIGFPDLKHFALMYDEEKGADAGIRYLQSIEEAAFAMPVMDPLIVVPNYNPQVNDELLSGLGELTEENIAVLVTVTVPSDLTRMTVNLQGPIVINSDNRKAAQIIVEGNDYTVKYPIYEILKARKDGE